MLPELHDAAIDHEGQLEGGKDYRLGECLERFQISNLRSQILTLNSTLRAGLGGASVLP